MNKPPNFQDFSVVVKDAMKKLTNPVPVLEYDSAKRVTKISYAVPGCVSSDFRVRMGKDSIVIDTVPTFELNAFTKPFSVSWSTRDMTGAVVPVKIKKASVVAGILSIELNYLEPEEEKFEEVSVN